MLNRNGRTPVFLTVAVLLAGIVRLAPAEVSVEEPAEEALPVVAAGAPPPPDPCANATTTREMESCLGEAKTDAFARVGEYAAEVDRLLADDPEVAQRFQEAQRLWQAWVEADCATFGASAGAGSVRHVWRLGCEVCQAEERSYWLWTNYLTGVDTALPEPPRCGNSP